LIAADLRVDADALVLSDAQYAVADPLITTVWAAVSPLVAGARFGESGGMLAGLVAVTTDFARTRSPHCVPVAFFAASSTALAAPSAGRTIAETRLRSGSRKSVLCAS